MASVTSANVENVPVNVRVNSVTAKNFSLLLQEEEKLDQIHVAEDVSYIAWDPSTTLADGYVIEAERKDAAVDNTLCPITFSQKMSTTPTLLADMQTAADKDPATLRYTALSPTGATFYVSEDKSKDTETTHAKEALGYIVLAPATITDTDNDGLTDEQEKFVYGTDPTKADTDGDGALDGHEIKAGTSATDPANTPPIALETGTLKVNHLWKSVTYAEGATYSKPVVVAKPASNKGPVSLIIQIKDVTSIGFKIRLQEQVSSARQGMSMF